MYRFLIRALRARRPRDGADLVLLRACGLAACPTGFETSAGARLTRERRALLAAIARARGWRRRARLAAALEGRPPS